MAVAETSPLREGAYQPVTWNFKLLAQHELDGFGGMGEGMSIQIAPDGRRIIWLAHESAPKNFTAVDVSDPRKPEGGGADRPAAGPHALELARALRQHHGGRLPDAEERTAAGRLRAVRHFGAGKAEIDRVLRLLGAALARRASALVLRRRICHMALGRTRLHADAPARRSVLPLRRRAQSVQAGRGRPLVDARHPPGRQRHAAAAARPSTRATAPTTPTSIRSARTAAISAYIDGGMFVLDISDKANPKTISQWDQFAALYRLHAHAWCRCSSAGSCW